MRLERAPAFSGTRIIVAALVASVGGAAAFIAGMILDRRQTLFSFLTTFDFVASTLVGGLAFLMILHAWRATWPIAFRRLLEAPLAALPLLPLAFIPIALEPGQLYDWVHPARIADPSVREVVMRKLAYLDRRFFLGRAYFYFALFVVAGELLRLWSLRQDASLSFPAAARMKRLSAALLLPLFFAATFASFDWICSLEPAWASSIFGFYWLTGGIVGALSLWIVCVRAVAAAGLVPHITPSHYYALGRCLFAAVCVWAYFAFFQFFLIWIADEPNESLWFVVRANDGWRWASVAILIIGHFALPFVALLPYAAKRAPNWLTGVSLWLLALHWLDGFWCVAPALHRDRFTFTWQDALMIPFLVGLATLVAALRLRGRAVAAWNDPAYLPALEYRSL